MGLIAAGDTTFLPLTLTVVNSIYDQVWLLAHKLKAVATT